MASRNRCPVVLVAAALAAFASTPAEAASQPATARVSVSTNGIQSAGGDSETPVISANGEFVAFSSPATNLVPSDTNAKKDVFVRELQAGVTTRVSVNSVGTEATGDSVNPSISDDGRFVAFDSSAADLVSGDTNAQNDVFIRDRQTGQTTRVSVDSAGAQATGGNSVVPSISSDGRVVAFLSNANNLVAGDTNAKKDIFVANLVTGETRRVSVGPGGAEGNGDSKAPSLSADGSAVAFQSLATNLVPGDTNAVDDVFVTRGSRPVRVSIGAGGVQGNGGSVDADISADGLSVGFVSAATNLVPNDTNGAIDVFVVRGGKAARMNLGPSGAEADHHSSGPSLTANGGIVAYASEATNLVANDTNANTDIFVSVLRATHGGLQLFP